MSADYSQVELRILAHVSGEPKLREAFARGEDIHAATAAEVLGKDQATLTKDERNIAKMVNFGIIYGISAFGLSENLEIPRDDAQAYIDTYLARFPLVQDFIQRTIEQAGRDGYVTTLLGRRRPVPEIRASNRQTRSLGERLAVNSVMQGTAADIIKIAMVNIYRRLRDEGRSSRLVLQVHDELLVEAPDAEVSTVKELVRKEMCDAYPLDPPAAVDVGAGRRLERGEGLASLPNRAGTRHRAVQAVRHRDMSGARPRYVSVGLVRTHRARSRGRPQALPELLDQLLRAVEEDRERVELGSRHLERDAHGRARASTSARATRRRRARAR